jgi:uncharacterized SAM-binding protein YcdF (DUF218 family)
VTPFVEFVKDFLVPGSSWFLILTASVCAGLLFGTPAMRKVGRGALVALVALYWAMSVPIVALVLQRTIGSGGLAHADSPVAGPLPIVVLGNGLDTFEAFGATVEVPLAQTAMNTLFALDRYRQFPTSILIASGGAEPGAAAGSSEAAIIADALRRNGVPEDRILLEDRSTTTREQAVATARILAARGAARCILVTSPQQMGRAAEVFQRAGISVIPLPARAVLGRQSGAAHWWLRLIPSSQARTVSRDVLYEVIASPYYRVRGWVG